MKDWEKEASILREWAQDVFLYARDVLHMEPAEPLDDLRGALISYTDAYGEQHRVTLFDREGRLVYHDLEFYTIDLFKNQGKKEFAEYNGSRFTWQQTVILTAYNRALDTFGRDSYDLSRRWISVRSGHGIGKTSVEAIIAQHFLLSLPGSTVGMTANTEKQVEDVFLKEFSKWTRRLPEGLRQSLRQTSDHVFVGEDKDWFLRAQVGRKETPESLAGLHGKYVLIIVDEASGVHDSVFEVMKGALTGDHFIVIYCSNPTRTEGEFFESHKAGSRFTKLHFSSRDSPIVKEGYIEGMEHDYPRLGGQKSDEVLIRVDGEFAGLTVMDDAGWIPLFSNIQINIEEEQGQIIRRGVIALDPAGMGKDRSIACIRDSVYLKEVLNEATSNPKDLARKLETIRDAYGCTSNDIGIEAFGEGAKVVGEVDTKMGEHVTGILTDKPREGTEDRFNSYKMELAWKFREWLLAGGIIISNHPAGWIKELEKIKYRRNKRGQMELIDKKTFKKEYGFSPDRFDSAIHTFFRDTASRPVHMTKEELEVREMQEFIRRAQSTGNARAHTSSM